MTGPRVDSPNRVPWVKEAHDDWSVPSVAREPILDLVHGLRCAKPTSPEQVCKAIGEWGVRLHQWLIREQQIAKEAEERDMLMPPNDTDLDDCNQDEVDDTGYGAYLDAPRARSQTQAATLSSCGLRVC